MSPAANPAPPQSGQALSRTLVTSWETQHLVDTGEWLTQQARLSRDSFDQVHQSIRGTDWSGDAKDAAVDRVSGDVVVVDRQASVMVEAATIASNGAQDVQAAKRDALEAIQDAEDDGFRVAENLSVSDARRLDVSDMGARYMAMKAHAETIQWRAGQLVQTDGLVGRRLAEKAAELDGIRFEGEGNRPTVQALGWGPWKENPEIPQPPPNPIEGPPVRGLPPPGINILPPVDGPVTVGPASRPSERALDGKSFWDTKGGEWRYDPGDKHHNPHWDYNSHENSRSRWDNVEIDGKPAHTPEAKPKSKPGKPSIPKAPAEPSAPKVPAEPSVPKADAPPGPRAPVEIPRGGGGGGGSGTFGPELVPLPHSDRHLPTLGTGEAESEDD